MSRKPGKVNLTFPFYLVLNFVSTISGKDQGSKDARGPRVFFDCEWIDEVVIALRAITESEKGKKS